MAELYSNDVWGSSHFIVKMKELAIWCDVVNPTYCSC